MIPAAIAAATVLSYAIGWIVSVPSLVPVFNLGAGFPFMLAALRRGDLRLAIARMLIWALALGVCATLLSYARPRQTEDLFLRATAYKTEMFAWVMTGRGAESTPSLFLPQHARDAAIFALLAVVSGGALAMAMGAALMNYMGHYVGALAAASARPLPTLLLGWHPWAVIRVASFVALGVILSTPVLSRVLGFTVDRRTAGRCAAWACGGLVADVVLKAMLAPAWQRLLLRMAGW